jgi:hypothetical protein
MKSVTEASARRTIGAGLTEAKRRRRWPVVLLWLIFLALVADSIGFMVYVSRYQPLSANTLASGIEDRQVATTIHAVSPGGEEFPQYRVGAAHGKGLWYSFTLANSGRLPVTITSIETSSPGPATDPPLRQIDARIGQPDDPGATAAEATTFEPFTLDANGGARLVVIDARFGACRRGEREAPGAAGFVGSAEVGYEVLGFYARRTIVTLPYTVEVPPDAGCGRAAPSSPQGA